MRFWLVFCLVWSFMAPVAAQTENEELGREAAVDISGFSSPRETLATFLQAMADANEGRYERIDRAVEALDLSEVNALVRSEKGRDLAWILLELLDADGGVKLKRVPAKTRNKSHVVKKFDRGEVRLAQQPDGRWLFSATTVRALPVMLEALTQKRRANGDSDNAASRLPWHLRFRGQLPAQLKEKWLLLEHWQWIGIFLTIVVGVLADKLTALTLRWTVRRWRQGGDVQQIRALPDDWLRPFGLLVLAALWWLGLNLLDLPERALVVLLVAVKVLVGCAGVWAGYRAMDFFSAQLQKHAHRTANKLDDVLVPLVRKTLKVFITVVGILFIATSLNLNVTSLVAGLGLGGLAFALAAKDLVQNLFGSITVLLDQSFHVGDWVVIDDIEGTVEEVGLRSTRIRTFYNSLVIMPNSRLITASVDNLGRRRFRRMKCNISLTYDTPPEKIEAFCEALRELVRLHPYMRKDYYHVYFNEMGAAALEILVYVFWETPDWSTELRERHRFLLDVLRVGRALDVEFAFPTQTIHLKSSDEPVPQPVAGRFDADELRREARAAATRVVEATTGLNRKPPPVSF